MIASFEYVPLGNTNVILLEPEAIGAVVVPLGFPEVPVYVSEPTVDEGIVPLKEITTLSTSVYLFKLLNVITGFVLVVLRLDPFSVIPDNVFVSPLGYI